MMLDLVRDGCKDKCSAIKKLIFSLESDLFKPTDLFVYFYYGNDETCKPIIDKVYKLEVILVDKTDNMFFSEFIKSYEELEKFFRTYSRMSKTMYLFGVDPRYFRDMDFYTAAKERVKLAKRMLNKLTSGYVFGSVPYLDERIKKVQRAKEFWEALLSEEKEIKKV